MPSSSSDSRHPSPLSPAEAGELAEGLSQLTGCGVPLADGLLVLADDVPSKSLRRAYQDLSQRLQSGVLLDEALEQLGDRVPEHLRGLAAAGIAAGRLGDVLSQFIRVQSRVQELRRGVWRSLAYPAVLLALLLLVFVVVKAFVVEPLADILETSSEAYGSFYSAKGPQFPTATKLLMAMPGLDVLGGVTLGGCVVVIWLCLRCSTPRVRHRIAANLPLVGPIWRNGSWAGFAGLLGVLIEERVPLPKALQLTGQGLYDRDVANACERISALTAAGQPLADCFQGGRRLPASLAVPLVDWGTRHGTLPEVLRSAAEMFVARSEAQAQFVGAVLPPLMFLVILAGIGFLVMAMYLPIVTVIQVLTG